MSSKKGWTYNAGKRPHTVTVYAREDGGVAGIIYGRAWDPARGRYVKRSLKHRDRDRAIAWADEQAAKLRQGVSDLRRGRVTLGLVLDAYLHHRTPKKPVKARKSDARAAEMWGRFLSLGSDPHAVSLREWEAFTDLRRTGAIDARGRRVKAEDRRPVRDRTIQSQLKWLSSVFRWASRWRTPAGHYLMREDPTRGLPVPSERNPRRPIISRDRFEALRAKSDAIPMDVRWSGKREERRSYLAELLDVAAGTGRRISAVCGLRFSDLRLERTKAAPYGAIRWAAATDKTGRETILPVGPEVRAALDRILRERPAVGDTPLFPSPTDPAEPITAGLAGAWLRRCEKAAGLEHQRGGGWHGLRRLFATERKHLPAVDVARAGGWRTVSMVQEVYSQADDETILQVVLGRGELREVGR